MDAATVKHIEKALRILDQNTYLYKRGLQDKSVVEAQIAALENCARHNFRNLPPLQLFCALSPKLECGTGRGSNANSKFLFLAKSGPCLDPMRCDLAARRVRSLGNLRKDAESGTIRRRARSVHLTSCPQDRPVELYPHIQEKSVRITKELTEEYLNSVSDSYTEVSHSQRHNAQPNLRDAKHSSMEKVANWLDQRGRFLRPYLAGNPQAVSSTLRSIRDMNLGGCSKVTNPLLREEEFGESMSANANISLMKNEEANIKDANCSNASSLQTVGRVHLHHKYLSYLRYCQDTRREIKSARLELEQWRQELRLNAQRHILLAEDKSRRESPTHITGGEIHAKGLVDVDEGKAERVGEEAGAQEFEESLA